MVINQVECDQVSVMISLLEDDDSDSLQEMAWSDIPWSDPRWLDPRPLVYNAAENAEACWDHISTACGS